MIYVFSPAGQCLQINFTSPQPPTSVFRDVFGADVVLKVYEVDPLPGVAVEDITATIASGEVVGDPQGPSAPPALWVHTTLTGGTQSPTGTLYVKNDGVDALTVHAELRDGPDPATSAAVTQLGGVDIDGTWALELVNTDTRALADTPLVQMTAGVIDATYTTNIAPCEVELAEDRLQMIGPYVLKLAQPLRFKIARSLS